MTCSRSSQSRTSIASAAHIHTGTGLMRCRNRHSAALTPPRLGDREPADHPGCRSLCTYSTILWPGPLCLWSFASQIREDPSLSMSIAGWIGSATFAAYCLGIVVSFVVVPKRGEGIVASLAGAGTGFLTDRLGIRFVHRLALLMMGLSPVTWRLRQPHLFLRSELWGSLVPATSCPAAHSYYRG